jgi:hypothetical protein
VRQREEELIACASQIRAARASVATICLPFGENLADHVRPEVLGSRAFSALQRLQRTRQHERHARRVILASWFFVVG